jgi:phosphohistidine phosphatase
MLLYLFRHADAVPLAGSDSARALSEKGVAQAKQAGRFCLRNRLLPEIILTSPLRRAEQTARLFAEEIDGQKIVSVAPFLACGMDPATALAELKAYRELESVMLVGHEPDLGRLASRLAGAGDRGKIKIRKASLTVFELDAARPDSAVLQFSIPAKLMG